MLVWLLRWRCCGGGRWRCHGSRTAAPSSDAAVSSGGERDSSSSPLLYFFRSFFLCFVYQRLCLCPLGFVFFFLISLPGFKLPLNLSFLSLFRYSLFDHFPLCPPFLLALSAVFIGQRGAGASLSPPYRCAWGDTPTCPATAPG